MDFRLIASLSGEADLGCCRWQSTLHTAKGDAVSANLLEPQSVEQGRDVGIEIPGPLNLIEELGGAGLGRDFAASAGGFGDDGLTRGGDLGNGVA